MKEVYSGENPANDETRPENRVADFVIERVKNFEELNAPNAEQGEMEFRKLLVQALRAKTFAEGENKLRRQDGNTARVYWFETAPGLVLKRLRTNKEDSQARFS